MKTSLKFIASTLIFFSFSHVGAVNLAQNFNFDGVLTDSSGNPLASPPSIVFQIYNPAENCLIYEESHSSVPLDATGGFSVKVGSGTRASPGVDGGLLLRTVFQNLAQVRAAGTNCTGGYTPAAGDGRKLKVTVNGTALTPMYSLSPTPMATVAESLQGKLPSDFVEISGTVTPANLLLLTNTGDASSLHHHDGRYALSGQLNGASLPALSAGQSLVWSGSSWTASTALTSEADPNVYAFAKASLPTCSANEVLKSDGTSLSCVIDNGGSGLTPANNLSDLTDIATARTNLGLGTAATRNVGLAAGNLVELDGGAKIPPAAMPPTLALANGTAAAPAYSFSSNSDTGLFSPGTGMLSLSTGGVERLRINSGGKIGIGTVAPVAKLHVTGDIVGGFVSAAAPNIDWSLGNVQTISNCASLNLNGMIDGGIYRLIVLDSSNLTACTFGGTGARTIHYPSGATNITTSPGVNAGTAPTLVTFIITPTKVLIEAKGYNAP